jgi:hypothetical protein
MSKGYTVTAARVLCYINGRLIGKVTTFRWNIETAKDEIRGVDSAFPFELAPGATRISGTLNLIKLVGDGGAEGLGMTAPEGHAITEQYFTLALVERLSDTTVFEAPFCSVTSQSWDAQSKGRVEGSISFRALTWNNESRID